MVQYSAWPAFGAEWEGKAMFRTNESTLDRALRVAVGLALLVWFFMDQSSGALHWLKLIGLVPLVTGLVGTCPVYSVLGISTCPVNRA